MLSMSQPADKHTMHVIDFSKPASTHVRGHLQATHLDVQARKCSRWPRLAHLAQCFSLRNRINTWDLRLNPFIGCMIRPRIVGVVLDIHGHGVSSWVRDLHNLLKELHQLECNAQQPLLFLVVAALAPSQLHGKLVGHGTAW
jgi:hypothetical protein